MNSSTFNFKKWLFSFALVTIGVCCFALLSCEWLIRTKVQKGDIFEQHRTLFFQSEFSNAVFGDSHVSQGFTGVDDFVNLGCPHESLGVVAKKIRLYYKDRLPGKVILQADPHLLSPSRSQQDVHLFAKEYDSKQRAILYSFRARHRMHLLNYFKVLFKKGAFKTKFSFQPDGAQTLDQIMSEVYSEAELKERIQRRVQLQRPVPNPEKSQVAHELESIVHYLKERGADVCLIGYPVSPSFALVTKQFPEYNMSRNYFRDLAKAKNIPYADFWDQIEDPQLFSSEDHLNLRGARIFARKVIEACFE